MAGGGSPRRWRLRFETVGSISAIVVGAAALFISYDQSRVMRAEQHASVLPALQVDAFTSTQDDMFRVGLRVSNNGVGPAFIESATLTRNGARRDRIDALFGVMPASTTDRSWMAMQGRSLAPGQTVEAFSVAWSRDTVEDAQIAALLSKLDEWDVTLCYCSAFDRCWTSSAAEMGRRPAERCEPAPSDVFEQFGLSAVTPEESS